jgi:hypothetical protein
MTENTTRVLGKIILKQQKLLHNVHEGTPGKCLSLIFHPAKNPDVPQQRNGYRKSVTFTQWSTTQLLITMNL